MKIFELESTVSGNLLVGLKRRIEMSGERVSELKDTWAEIIPSKKQGEKPRNKHSLRHLQEYIYKTLTFVPLKS